MRLTIGVRPEVHRFGDGADDETAGRAVEGNGEEDHGVAAAEIIGLSDRKMRRWRERFQQEGYSGLADRRKGKPTSHRVPLETVEEVFRLYQEQYRFFNVRHFHEKLRDEHQIEISYTWLYQPLVERVWSTNGTGARRTAGVVSAGRCLDAVAYRRQ